AMCNLLVADLARAREKRNPWVAYRRKARSDAEAQRAQRAAEEDNALASSATLCVDLLLSSRASSGFGARPGENLRHVGLLGERAEGAAPIAADPGAAESIGHCPRREADQERPL